MKDILIALLVIILIIVSVIAVDQYQTKQYCNTTPLDQIEWEKCR